ncbi:MAG TPA: hypothetical protein VFH47_04430, partial [Candidatus Thermoplasmatota archaeon]|nr:hypothetical protein [Candidatus Thermoplasmatota archaeon]
MTRTLPAATALAATALLAGCLAGAGAPAMQTSRAEASEAFELWLTDAPANVTSLHLVVATVEVGGVPLDIVQDAFDLLAHRGPEQAILIARGFVPPAQRDHVEVAFAAAVAVV